MLLLNSFKLMDRESLASEISANSFNLNNKQNDK